MRWMVAVLASLAAWPAGVAAEPPSEDVVAFSVVRRGVQDPRAFVASRYEAYLRDPNGPDEPAFAYSDRLGALFLAYEDWTEQHDDLVGSLVFDWWTNAQDWALADVRVTEARDGPDRRTVRARFSNGGRPDEIRFLFVRQGELWFLDDAIEGTGSGDGGWTLSDLLRERE